MSQPGPRHVRNLCMRTQALMSNIADQCILVFVSEGGGMAHICRTKKNIENDTCARFVEELKKCEYQLHVK